MTPDQNCFDFIKNHEGCKLSAYKDSAGIWTIGYGTIAYEDATPVRPGDTISQQRAEQLLAGEVTQKSAAVNKAIGAANLNQNQYNALVSFSYNVGAGGFRDSTLLKRVLADPGDPTIRDAFMMWDKARVNGELVVVEGLKNRRQEEANLYFS